jgi:ABC-type bacteriocin/lantibiotic exporter with double-glycine peptidase domain
MAVPAIYNLLLQTAAYQTDIGPLTATAVFLIAVTVGAGLFSSAKQLVCSKIRNEMTLAVEAAAMMRILSLPLTFFRKHSQLWVEIFSSPQIHFASQGVKTGPSRLMLSPK